MVADLYETRKFAAEAAGISADMLARYIRNDNKPSFNAMVDMCTPKNVSISWLAKGEGSMWDSSISNGSSQQDAHANSVQDVANAGVYDLGTPDDYAYITLYDAACSAGGGAWNDQCTPLTKLAFTKYSLRKKGLDSKTLSAIRVSGDSMEGDLSDGDAVMIDHSRREVKGEGIYVIRLDGHLYAKRLQRTFDGMEILSTNKAYGKMHVPKDRLGELDIIGQVVWSASWRI
jgi:phage repressor protein C with HTH and peptisase S24 domain